MGRYKKLFSNTLILGLGTFASKFLVFFMMPLYTACLSPEQYSVADLISQTANLLIPFACAGIADGVFRFAMEETADKKRVFSSGLFVLLAMSLIFLCLSPLLGLYRILDSYVWLVVLYVLAANFHSVVAQYIRARGNMTLFSFGGIVGTALTIAFNLVFLLGFDMGITGYVLSVILGDVLVTALLLLLSGVWRDIDFRLVQRTKMREMLRYSVPMIPTTIFWWVTSVSDRFLVIAMQGSEVNGLYAAAYKAPTLLTLFCTVFIEAWQFSAVSERNEGERSTFFTRVFAGYQGLIFMAASALTLLSIPVTRILLADSYFASWQYIPPLALAMAYSALVTFMGSVYMVRKKSVYSFLTAAVGAVVNVVFNLLLIPKYSAMGAAVATFISYFVVLVIRGAHTVKLVRFRLGLPRLVFNTTALLGQSVLMLSDLRLRFLWSSLIFVAILAVNGQVVFGAVLEAVRNLKKKMQKKRKKF